jgi:glucokinase
MIGAVDIGGTKVAVGIVDGEGVVRSRMEAPTGPNSDYATALQNTIGMLRQTATNAGAGITGIATAQNSLEPKK